MASIYSESSRINSVLNGGQNQHKSHEPSNSSVHLTLARRPSDLLHLSKLLKAPCSAVNDDTDVQVQRLVQLAWIVTIRTFTASTALYIAEDYMQGRCYVGGTHEIMIGSPVQIHVDTQDKVQDLFRTIVAASSVVNDTPEHHGKDGNDSRYNTIILYRGQNRQTNGIKPFTDLYQDLYSTPIAEPSELEPNTGLILSINRTPEVCLQATLHVETTTVSLQLATSLLHSFDQALSSIGSISTQTIGAVEMCSSHDRELIANFTRSLSPTQDALLHELCLQHVKTTPEAQAVCSWDGDLTYSELNDLSSRLAHWLVGQGVGPGVYIACMFYKSTWAIVARLAVLMAGGAYICVDAHDPPPYLASVLERTKSTLMLTSVGFSDKFSNLVRTNFEVSKASLQNLPHMTGVPCITVTPSDPCVVLFTSGSTGSPKGIIQEHRSYASSLTDYIRVTGMGPHSRLFQLDFYAFDISNNDFIAPLIAGGCCCVPTVSLTVESLMIDMNNLQANMTFVTPSVAIDITPDRVPTLKTMCIGGEPVSDAVLSKWLGRVRVINQYGMGEVASLCAFNPNLQVGRGSVVGRPATGAIWLVNPDISDQLMPVGAVGEVVIEGPHVSRGYLDHISGKSENFLSVPPAWMAQLHPERPANRLYRSGDLGRYNHDGTIELIGRKDTMLKLDGSRVEAVQVENILRRQLSTGDVAVVDVVGAPDGVSQPILVAYVYLSSNPMNVDDGAFENMEFRPVMNCHAIYPLTQAMGEAAAQNLPTYCVPSLFLLIDRIPQTKSKKTDRRKLHLLGQAYYMSQREELRDITVWPQW
ncbi:AMP-dependent synthetase/ligase [Penicillium taxi]|uniref:AMP-dependent synthetase/ligase n=1 Tax=Penicillium taxi TaxID=168475 RepID=UPI002545A3A2|nr:AMP-dependent synthetase/ligase [Penicillium taxi]KAJ5902567.1 AMP-dependent synthetase/ligase [Penicillium taxi]